MEGEKHFWSMTEGTFNCLIDKDRTLAFKKAIFNTVKKGDIVVDMGTGSGILAMFAADAGAKKVYAIELDEKNIKSLKNTFLINGFKDKIEVIKGDATKVEVPEKVDVIIGEMISTGLIEELQIPAMSNLLKYGKDDVKVFLLKYKSFVDLVYNKDIFYNYKFEILRYEYSDVKDTKSDVFSNQIEYSEVDFSKLNKNYNISKKINLEIKKSGVINGVRISGRTYFFDGSVFEESFAYSFPVILPLEDVKVKKGDWFTLNLRYKMCGGIDSLKYSLYKK